MKQFMNILCVIDHEADNQQLIQRAVTLAENNQARLTVVAVTEQIPAHLQIIEGTLSSDALQQAMIDYHKEALENLIKPYNKNDRIETRVLTGLTFLAVIRQVLKENHDLVIKSPEAPDWLNQFFSSDDMHLFRKCPCPVWIIKSQEKNNYQRILAAVDVDDVLTPEKKASQSSLNQQTINMACSLALSDFAELHVVHVWHALGESAMRGAFLDMPEQNVTDYVEQIRLQREASLDKLMKNIFSQFEQDSIDYIKPKIHLVKGWARKEIPALVKRINADLVVMGTVARTGIHGLLIGNTAETILNQIECSVLAIKPPGFESPIELEE